MNKQNFLIYDVETTGFPDNWGAPVENVSNWPEIVQIAWQKRNNEGEIVSSASMIVKPDGYIIPQKSTDIHGITTERAKEVGSSLPLVMTLFAKEFTEDVKAGIPLVAVCHNVNFDKRVVGSRFCKLGGIAKTEFFPMFNSLPHFCTMQNSTDYCKLPNPKRKGTFKFPNLQELHFKVFGTQFEGAHTAGGDVDATANILFALRKRGIFQI